MNESELKRWMREAIRLARRGIGQVSPNPLVGAVIVKRGQMIGEGAHLRFGGPHAEVKALADAGTRSENATLVVNLEPCCHYGKTPPCTDRILESGIRELICGMKDPFPKVRGKGLRILEKAGIRVRTGILEEECRELNEGFIHRVTRGRPFVTLKSAMTLDGKVATRARDSRWITSEFARRRGHRWRYSADAVLTGIGTVQVDDPLLTPRLHKRRKRVHYRIVLDPAAEMPLDSRLAGSLEEGPVLVFVGETAAGRRKEKLASHGFEVHPVPCINRQRLDLNAVMGTLGRIPINSVLVECGPRLAGGFLEQGLIDRWIVHAAPLLLGDASALSAFTGRHSAKISGAVPFKIKRVRRVGPDVEIVAEPDGGRV